MIVCPVLVGVDKDSHFDFIFAYEGNNGLSVLIVLVVATGESFRTGNESALEGLRLSPMKGAKASFPWEASLFCPESSTSVESNSAFTDLFFAS